MGDGIARVYGLSTAMAGEMLDFPKAGVKGVAFNLEENSVGVIILGDYKAIHEGDVVRCTGSLFVADSRPSSAVSISSVGSSISFGNL